MKNAIFAVLFVVLCVCLIFGLPGRIAAQASPSLKLTQLSNLEFVDLAKVAMVRFPVHTQAPRGCDDCQTRWGAQFLIDGVFIEYSEEAEVTLRKLLGNPQ